MNKRISVFFIVLMLLFSWQLKADNNNDKSSSKNNATVSITGQIVDQFTGEALTGVKVEIKELNKEVYTDFDGKFKVENINSGKYSIEAQYISYKNITIESLNISQENENSLKIEMAPIEN
mgnify:CR=1 FL=1